MSLHKSNTAWMSWWAPPSYLRHCNCDWLNYTMWSNGSCRRIHGMVAAILFPKDQVMYDWLNHTTWFESNRALPETWNLTQCCFIFLHNTDANMLCRLFDDHKYMDIYLPILQEYCYLGKQKKRLYFSASTCEHLWPSPSNLLNCAKCSHNPSKDAANLSVVSNFKSLLNFNFFGLKSGLVKLVRSWMCRHENIMVILDVQLWELGTQRLHQGLSETILVNTLTDVREFKNGYLYVSYHRKISDKSQIIQNYLS